DRSGFGQPADAVSVRADGSRGRSGRDERGIALALPPAAQEPPRQVVIGFDPTEDPTHGQQELALFNGHYGSYCYLPLFAFARVVGESEEYLVSAELPESHTRDPETLLGTLARLVAALRERWPGVKVIFRADAWFAVPEIYDWCEEHRVGYAIALPANAVLTRESAWWQESAQAAAEGAKSKTARRFGEFPYRAQGWRRYREVVVKAEVTPLGPNRRFVLTHGVEGKPRQRYRFYCGRGDSENR